MNGLEVNEIVMVAPSSQIVSITLEFVVAHVHGVHLLENRRLKDHCRCFLKNHLL